MISEKPWKLEAVILFGAILFAGKIAGMLLGMFIGLAGQQGWIPAAHTGFFSFLIGALSFQGAILVGLYYFLRHFQTGWGAAFGFSKSNRLTATGGGLIVGLLILSPVYLLGTMSTDLLTWLHVSAPPQHAVNLIRETKPVPQIIAQGIFAILLAPVAEELFFRGMLYPACKQTGHPRFALWGTAAFFAASHFNLMSFVPLLFLALVLTVLYEATENLLAPIFAHATFNAVNFYLIVAPPEWKPDWFTA